MNCPLETIPFYLKTGLAVAAFAKNILLISNFIYVNFSSGIRVRYIPNYAIVFAITTLISGIICT